MNRAVPLALAVLLAGGAVWFLARGDAVRTDEILFRIERSIGANRQAEARDALERHRDALGPGRAAYAESLMAFASGDAEKTAALAAEAAALLPGDWRPVSIVYYAHQLAGRPGVGRATVEAHLAAHPGDERAMTVLAEDCTMPGGSDVDPSRALALLDRIDALPARAAPPGDPTAVPVERLEKIRMQASALLDRRQGAVAAAERRVREAPASLEARMQLANALREARDLGRARAAAREAVAMAPDAADPLEFLILLLLETDDTGDDALPLAETLLRLRGPKDPNARIVLARSLVRSKKVPPEGGAPVDRIDEAIDVYRGLLAEPLPKEVRAVVLRNCAVALYDWKQGGRPGDYLDQAHRMLSEYVKLGGAVDATLADTWSKLQAHARSKTGDGESPK